MNWNDIEEAAIETLSSVTDQSAVIRLQRVIEQARLKALAKEELSAITLSDIFTLLLP